jgi:putative ABC transport system permease protein
METLLKDIGYGFRSMFKHSGFTALVIVTLALGIGASSAIFSVVNTVLLRQLPYRQADRIVAIQEFNSEGTRGQVTPANFLDWRAQNTAFEHLSAILTRPANLATQDQAERIELAMTSANFFSVFGTEPIHGRLFIASDEQAGHASVVVLSHAFGKDVSRAIRNRWQTDHDRRQQLHRDWYRPSGLSIPRQDRGLGAAVPARSSVE